MACTVCSRRRRTGGSLAAAASQSQAQRHGDRASGSWCARRASGLGRPQDRPLPGTRGPSSARDLDRARDPASARPRLSAGWQAGGALSALRDGGSEPVVADGLQGAHCACRRQRLSSADGDRRPLPLHALPRRLPRHPQSRGKNERFHRTLDAEVFAFERFRDLAAVQRAFDRWRDIYNLDRPHEALGQETPASRYRPSPRAMPERLPQVEYDDHEIVRTVSSTKAYVSFKGRLWKVPQAFCGERLAIRPLSTDGRYAVCFAAHPIATVDLTNNQTVRHVSEQG